MDIMTPDKRRKTMQAIRSKDTSSEILLRKELWKRGYRGYRKNYKKVTGNPDIVFFSLKIAIFIDSEFFHGFNWGKKKNQIATNSEYWIPKIERNMERDRRYTEQLTNEGWVVLRFWDHEIKKNLQECISNIENAIAKGKQKRDLK